MEFTIPPFSSSLVELSGGFALHLYKRPFPAFLEVVIIIYVRHGYIKIPSTIKIQNFFKVLLSTLAEAACRICMPWKLSVALVSLTDRGVLPEVNRCDTYGQILKVQIL